MYQTCMKGWTDMYDLKWGLLPILILNSISDIRRREILPAPTLFWGAAGILCTAVSSGEATDIIQRMPSCLSCGYCVMLFSLLSRGSIGMGDGILLCVCGLWIGSAQTWLLFAAALLPAMLFSLLPPVRNREPVPLVPFVTTIYIWQLLSGFL